MISDFRAKQREQDKEKLKRIIQENETESMNLDAAVAARTWRRRVKFAHFWVIVVGGVLSSLYDLPGYAVFCAIEIVGGVVSTKKLKGGIIATAIGCATYLLLKLVGGARGSHFWGGTMSLLALASSGCAGGFDIMDSVEKIFTCCFNLGFFIAVYTTVSLT